MSEFAQMMGVIRSRRDRNLVDELMAYRNADNNITDLFKLLRSSSAKKSQIDFLLSQIEKDLQTAANVRARALAPEKPESGTKAA